MKLIEFLSHPALQGLEALVALGMAMIPLIAFLVRKLQRRDHPEAQPPRSEARGYSFRIPEGPMGCSGFIIGTLLIIPTIFLFSIVLLVFVGIGFNMASIRETVEAYKAANAQAGNSGIFLFVVLYGVISFCSLVAAQVMFYRNGVSRGLNFYIWTMSIVGSLIMPLMGLTLKAPTSFSVILFIAPLLSAFAITGVIWLTGLIWQRG